MAPQKPKAKKSLLERDWRQDAHRFGQQAMIKLFGNTINWEKQRDVVKNNVTLGMEHFHKGNFKDALLRFKITTWLDPRNAEAWYYLGRTQLALGKPNLAIAPLKKALALKPQHGEAAYLMATALGTSAPAQTLPKYMPLTLARDHFDGIAEGFSKEQVEAYGYEGHTHVTQALRAALAPGKVDNAILELGVGSGLCGPLLRDVSARLVGVDISQRMIKEAAKLEAGGRKTYDELVHKEMHGYMQESPDAAWDAILASSVASYLGDLHPLFTQVARLLKPGGVFALTADKMDGQDFRFDAAAGRFRFSEAYLKGLASDVGLQVVQFGSVNAYPDYPVWLSVFKK